MLFGHPKYDAFQDTTPYKHLLIRFIYIAMENHEILPLTAIAPDALAYLGVDVVYDPSNFSKIREELEEIRLSMPSEGSPPLVPADEPVFLLRSADPLGPGAAKHWRDQAVKEGISAARILSATRQIEAMDNYRKKHAAGGSNNVQT